MARIMHLLREACVDRKILIFLKCGISRLRTEIGSHFWELFDYLKRRPRMLVGLFLPSPLFRRSSSRKRQWAEALGHETTYNFGFCDH
jgi:hypothetical protein